MKAKIWILSFATAIVAFGFQHALRAEETPPPASNVFLDEGDADYEMPKVEESQPTSSHKKAVSSDRSTARDDEDGPATGTLGDAFDQLQNSETPEGTAPKAALPVKTKLVEKVAPPKHREAASARVSGFRTTKDGECVMYSGANKSSSKILVVKGSKKLWVEEDGEWFKAYHKKGEGYLSAECFQ